MIGAMARTRNFKCETKRLSRLLPLAQEHMRLTQTLGCRYELRAAHPMQHALHLQHVRMIARSLSILASTHAQRSNFNPEKDNVRIRVPPCALEEWDGAQVAVLRSLPLLQLYLDSSQLHRQLPPEKT